MEKFLLKSISPQLLLMFLPTLLIKVSHFFRDKDENITGTDDVMAKLLEASAAVVATMDDGDGGTSFKKALKIIRDVCDGYLGAQK